MIMDPAIRAKIAFDRSFENQDKAVDEAKTENEFQYAVAFYTGFREALRELFPGIDTK